jgi:hypothetical protein
MAVTITEGTTTNIKTTTDSGAEIQHIRADGGTVGLLSSLTNGTVRVSVGTIVAGTLTALGNGTIGAGTVQTYGLRHADAFATITSNTGTMLGTVKAGVAGSAHYITDMTISAQTEANVALYAGSTLVRAGTYYLADNGGLVNNLNTPIIIDAGSEITFNTIGTGLVTLELRGYID